MEGGEEKEGIKKTKRKGRRIYDTKESKGRRRRGVRRK
jgi:hypothetical protein